MIHIIRITIVRVILGTLLLLDVFANPTDFLGAETVSKVLSGFELQQRLSYLNKLEFNGLMTLADETTVSLSHKTEGGNLWVRVGGSSRGISVLGVEGRPLTVHVSMEGLNRFITLKKANILPMNFHFGLKPTKYTEADVSFDATQIMLFERMEEIEKNRLRKWEAAALRRKNKQ